MKIDGKVHCFFEQSGTFKNEFIKLGIQAEDYDIQNNFGETDHIVDLFDEIDNAYAGESTTLFDTIRENDLIMAFYPCIYFCEASQMACSLTWNNYRKLQFQERICQILDRIEKRYDFYTRLIRLVADCEKRNLRLIIENPWNMPSYLKQNFLKEPDIVDNNRLLRGDYFRKPTAYWFWNCEPTHGFSYQKDKKQKIVEKSKQSGIKGVCSEERSMISPDYARNFICDFILGKEQNGSQMRLFEDVRGEPNEGNAG